MTHSIPLPRETANLVGHQEAARLLKRRFDGGNLAHAWLIHGPEGVGKATLAYRFARYVLLGGSSPDESPVNGSPVNEALADGLSSGGLFEAPVDSSHDTHDTHDARFDNDAHDAHDARFDNDTHNARFVNDDGLFMPADTPFFHRVAALGHADLFVLERRMKEEGNKQSMSDIITVDDVRTARHFLHKTPAESRWRVVIVDAADDFNADSGNALLKILEEPAPRCLLLVLAHRKEGVLKTIRSRCLPLELLPLDDSVLRAYLTTLYAHAGRAPQTIERAVALADGCVGQAVRLLHDDGEGDNTGASGLALYDEVISILANFPQLDGERLHALADRTAGTDGEGGFYWGMKFLRRIVAMCVKASSGIVVTGEAEENAVIMRLSAQGTLEHWASVWEKTGNMARDTRRVNLDKKQVLLSAFYMMRP